MKNKKPLLIALIVLDVIITVALLVVAIIMLTKNATMTRDEIMNAKGFIGYLQRNPTIYGICFVIPLFVLLVANIVGLMIYVKKTSKKEEVQVNDLTEEQKEALRQELLKELQGNKE